MLHNFDNSKFHVHKCKPHTNAVPWSSPKGHVYVRLNVFFVLLAEPVAIIIQNTWMKLNDHMSFISGVLGKIPTVRIVQDSFWPIYWNPDVFILLKNCILKILSTPLTFCKHPISLRWRQSVLFETKYMLRH